jgi:rubrerythrin
MDTMHMKPEAIAKQVGRSPSWVLRRVQLLELEPRVQAAVQDNTISATMAEEAFLKLKHHGDQLQLLKEVNDSARCGRVPTAKAVEQSANGLVKQRSKIEVIAKHIQELGEKCKFPVCPKCGGPASPDGWDMDLKKNKVSCSHYHGAWNLITGPIKDRETTLDGNVSGREKTVPGGESVVKVESKDHLSNIAIQDYFDHLAKLVTKAEAVSMIQVGEEFGSDDDDEELSITIKIDRKKLPKFPNVLLGPPEGKKAKHATDATIQVGGWGGNNEAVLEHRTRLWDLEKAIDAKTQPAEIVRHELERLVVDHVALSKGKELITPNGTRTIRAVHRDYTAIIADPTGHTQLYEESEVRNIVKAAKTNGENKEKAIKQFVKKDKVGLTHNVLGHRFLRGKVGPKIGDPVDWMCTRCGITVETKDLPSVKDECAPIKAKKGG